VSDVSRTHPPSIQLGGCSFECRSVSSKLLGLGWREATGWLLQNDRQPLPAVRFRTPRLIARGKPRLSSIKPASATTGMALKDEKADAGEKAAVQTTKR
jgi:hypothetical protein